MARNEGKFSHQRRSSEAEVVDERATSNTLPDGGVLDTSSLGLTSLVGSDAFATICSALERTAYVSVLFYSTPTTVPS